MLGIFMLGVIGVGCLYQSCKNASEDGRNRQGAINRKDPYYIDWEGNCRRVDNGHKVCRYTTSMNANWDTVDVDLKTGEILRNHSQERRNEIKVREERFKRENMERKNKAIEEGKLWYNSYEANKEKMARGAYYSYSFVPRRVSDNLLLDERRTSNVQMNENKFGLLLWRDENQYKKYPTINSIEKDKEYNWRCINSKYKQEDYNMTAKEIEEYARKVGAIL